VVIFARVKIDCSMAAVIIAATSIYNWELASDVELRIYALQSFWGSDGYEVVAGNPSEDSSDNDLFFAIAACTFGGPGSGTLNIAAITLESTTDSSNPNATYAAYFYTLEGQRLAVFGEFGSFALPPTPNSTTWGAVAAAQGSTL
jgi:hypothetical protein